MLRKPTWNYILKHFLCSQQLHYCYCYCYCFLNIWQSQLYRWTIYTTHLHHPILSSYLSTKLIGVNFIDCHYSKDHKPLHKTPNTLLTHPFKHKKKTRKTSRFTIHFNPPIVLYLSTSHQPASLEPFKINYDGLSCWNLIQKPKPGDSKLKGSPTFSGSEKGFCCVVVREVGIFTIINLAISKRASKTASIIWMIGVYAWFTKKYNRAIMLCKTKWLWY